MPAPAAANSTVLTDTEMRVLVAVHVVGVDDPLVLHDVAVHGVVGDYTAPPGPAATKRSVTADPEVEPSASSACGGPNQLAFAAGSAQALNTRSREAS